MRGGRQGQPLPNTRWLLPVWLFPGVCPQMSCEIRRSGEDLATVPEAEGREVGEALGWSTLPFSRFLFIQSPAQRLYTWWQDLSCQNPTSVSALCLEPRHLTKHRAEGPASRLRSGGLSGWDQRGSLENVLPTPNTVSNGRNCSAGLTILPSALADQLCSSGFCAQSGEAKLHTGLR